jgi:ligand-binding sensor domain-containing protein
MSRTRYTARSAWNAPLCLVAGLALAGCTLDFDQFADSGNTEPDANLTPTKMDAMVLPDVGGGGAGDIGPLPDGGVMDDGGMTGADGDGDGIADDVDNCPETENADQADADMDDIGDACDPDADGDDVPDDMDNCPGLANPAQLDLDRDSAGDACDDDVDGDGILNDDEAGAGTDPRRADSDGDGSLDGDDSCPTLPDRVGLDTDGDGEGDVCDSDDDGDMIADWRDSCPYTANADQADADMDGRGDACADDLDGDGVTDEMDTCPARPNPDQAVTPCASPFEIRPYDRDVRDVVAGGDTAYAATAGGVLVVGPDGVDSWTNADGLPGNRITGAAVDASGRRWFATDRGLAVVRPDGFIFAVGATDAGDAPEGELRDVAVSADETVWVSTANGLYSLGADGWSQVVEGLPSNDVSGLWIDDMDRLWAATDGGVARFAAGVINGVFNGFEGGDAFVNVTGDADGTYWLLGPGGAVHIGADDMPIRLYGGFSATSAAPAGDTDLYLGTDAGVARIDGQGRLYPAGGALLPSPEVRGLARTAGGPTWVGTAGGLIGLEGYFASYTPSGDTLPNGCVRDGLRIGDHLWIATEGGLYRVDAAGNFAQVDPAGIPGAEITALAHVGDDVWVGTNNGVARVDLMGMVQEEIGSADNLAFNSEVTDIVAGINGQVWFGTSGAGVVRRDADGTLAVFNQAQSQARFVSDLVNALAHDGAKLYIATPFGVTVYSEALAAGAVDEPFELPITDASGRLPQREARDVAVRDGTIYVATPSGVAVGEPGDDWSTLRRANDAWPVSASTDSVAAVAVDADWLWVLLADRQQRAYSLVRRQRVVADGEMAQVDVFEPDAAGLPAMPGDRVRASSGEVFLSYCGDQNMPGAFVVLDDTAVVARDVSDAHGLPRGSGAVALTRGPDGRPLFAAAGAGAGGEPIGLSLGADGTVSEVELPGNMNTIPTQCDATPNEDPGQRVLWCVLDGVGAGRRDNTGAWVVIDSSASGIFGMGTVQAVVAETEARIWVASTAGVARIENGNPTLFNRASTEQGIPDDDARALDVSAEGQLFVGTAGGLGIMTMVNGAPSWEAVLQSTDGLLNDDILAVAAGSGGEVFIGTADGLFHRAADGTFTGYDTGAGLPANRVDALAWRATDGALLVGTPAGLAVGTGAGGALSFQTLGFVDGLPGDSVQDIVVLEDGVAWIRSDDGVAVLQP